MMSNQKKEWRFKDGYWVGPDWPLSILYWTPAALMVAIVVLLAVLAGVSVVALWMSLT